jgi:cytochrome c oxidase subunit 1
MIVIPNAVQIFCWTATLWSGRVRVELPLAWILGFFAIFVLGGLSGVTLASVSIDQQVHDTFYVVAHLHYVLIGGALFPLFGAFYYWFPKWTGRMLGTRLGWLNFAAMFIGFNVAFYPMHHLGFLGMPRRVYTYLPENQWGEWNLVATIGAWVLGVGALIFLANVFWSRRHGKLAGDDPWGGGTLEWATTSPPPPYNFLYIPTVRGTYPVWENPPDTPVVTGLSTVKREVLVTTLHDARPDHRYHMAGRSIWTVVLAVATGGLMIGLIFHPISFPIGFFAVMATLAGWFWPTFEPYPITEKDQREEREMGLREHVAPEN